MRIARIIFIGVLTLSASRTFGQPVVTKPEVGKPLSEFRFDNVKNYLKDNVSLADFRGKWLFLEMWSANCKACIYSLPKIQKIQDQFQGEIHFFLVGENDHSNKGIEKAYENAVKNRGIRIPSAFDSTFFTKFDVASFPQIFIVDPKGILRYVTTGIDMTVEKIRLLLDGKKVSFLPLYEDVEHPKFDVVEAFGGNRLLSCSVLTSWNNGEINSGYPIDVFAKLPELWPPGWKVAGVGLSDLYNYAYFGDAYWMWYDSAYYGKVWSKPLLELRDTSAFRIVQASEGNRGIYNYCLKVPDSSISREKIMNELQRSLTLAFGYTAAIERRNMPVWKLIARPETFARLHTRGGKRFLSPGSIRAGFTVRNYDMQTFLAAVSDNLFIKERLAFIDETGIKDKIDITLEADMTNLEAVRQALQKQGMDLVKGTREMKVLVIRDHN